MADKQVREFYMMDDPFHKVEDFRASIDADYSSFELGMSRLFNLTASQLGIARQFLGPKPMPKYVAFGGPVTSPVDGDTHFINARTVCRLYKVDPRDCIFIDDTPTQSLGLDLEQYICLYPDSTGKYELPIPKELVADNERVAEMRKAVVANPYDEGLWGIYADTVAEVSKDEKAALKIRESKGKQYAYALGHSLYAVFCTRGPCIEDGGLDTEVQFYINLYEFLNYFNNSYNRHFIQKLLKQPIARIYTKYVDNYDVSYHDGQMIIQHTKRPYVYIHDSNLSPRHHLYQTHFTAIEVHPESHQYFPTIRVNPSIPFTIDVLAIVRHACAVALAYCIRNDARKIVCEYDVKSNTLTLESGVVVENLIPEK